MKPLPRGHPGPDVEGDTGELLSPPILHLCPKLPLSLQSSQGHNARSWIPVLTENHHLNQQKHQCGCFSKIYRNGYYEQNKQVGTKTDSGVCSFLPIQYQQHKPLFSVSGLCMLLSCSPSSVTWAGIIPVDISSWSNIICKEKALDCRSIRAWLEKKGLGPPALQ